MADEDEGFFPRRSLHGIVDEPLLTLRLGLMACGFWGWRFEGYEEIATRRAAIVVLVVAEMPMRGGGGNAIDMTPAPRNERRRNAETVSQRDEMANTKNSILQHLTDAIDNKINRPHPRLHFSSAAASNQHEPWGMHFPSLPHLRLNHLFSCGVVESKRKGLNRLPGTFFISLFSRKLDGPSNEW